MVVLVKFYCIYCHHLCFQSLPKGGLCLMLPGLTWCFFWGGGVFFCWFCVVIRFFHPCNNGQWPPSSRDLCPKFYRLHCFPILILEKEPVFSFWMLSAKQGNSWYHFYNVFGMTQSLTGDWTLDLPHWMPALYY